MRKLSLITNLITAISITLFFFTGKAFADSSTPLLRKFELLQIKNQQKLLATDKLIKKFTHSSSTSSTKPMSLLRNIDRRKEYLLRRDFLSRVIVQIENHYNKQNYSYFLIKQLSLMAEHESKSPNPDLILLRFILNCKDVLINNPKENTDAAELIDRFMNFTTISKLKTSALFYQEQDYSNGTETFKANNITADQVGERVADKIKQQEILNERRLSKEFSSDLEALIEPPEDKMIERRIKLEQRLKKQKVDIKSVEKPLKNIRKVKPTDKLPIMDQEQFNNLFKSK